MLEREVEKAVVDYAEAKGCISIKLDGMHNRGKPDRLFFYSGRTLVIEFKAPDKTPTKLQQDWLRKFREAGFDAECIDNIGRGKTKVDRFMKTAKADDYDDL